MKLKSAIVGFSYLAGLICAFSLNEGSLFCVVAFIIMFTAGFAFAFFKMPNIGAFLLVFGIAFGVYTAYRLTSLDFIYSLDGQKRGISGIIVNKTSPSNDTAGYTVETSVDGVKTLFSLYADDVDAEIGDTIDLNVKFSLLRDNTVFAESSYYLSKGVFLKATAMLPIAAHRNETFSPVKAIRGFNEYLKGKILTAFPNDTGALICAMFLGDKSSLSPALSRDITRAGVSHYASVSGLHLTLMVHLFMSLFGLTRLRVMRRFKFAFLIFTVSVFLIFFNLSPSVVRAGIMLIVYYGGELFMRRGNTLNSIGFAVLVILLFSPYACLDVALLLSAAGTIGIGVIAPVINKRFASSRFKVFREAFVGNLCANYATLPLVAVFFGGASLVSPITSIILLPFFMVMITAMMVFAVTAGLDGMTLFVSGLMSRTSAVIINFSGGLKFAYVSLDYGFVIPWAIVSAIFVFMIWLCYKKTGMTIKSAVISLYSLAFMIVCARWLDLDKTFLDVYTDGSSACVFLRNRNNSAAIVTNDGIKCFYAAEDYLNNNFLDRFNMLCVLNSTKNSLPYFAEIPAIINLSPENNYGVYDVGGIFTVTRNGGEIYITYDDIEISVTDVKASSAADISITYGYSVNTGDFSGLVINTSHRQEAIAPDRLNAYYEKISFTLRKIK